MLGGKLYRNGGQPRGSKSSTAIVPIYTGDARENLYGCLPCPKCGDDHRAAFPKSGMIECDGCGFKEPYVVQEKDHG